MQTYSRKTSKHSLGSMYLHIPPRSPDNRHPARSAALALESGASPDLQCEGLRKFKLTRLTVNVPRSSDEQQAKELGNINSFRRLI